MPLYEEKLISPLAVRFTQQRIREIFKDGRELEATIKEITASPGLGDYDIILHAPFPDIEILRWAPNGRRKGGGEHWFSFDNRRLYCLQRLAMEYWPKRVAARVEVLYADSGTIRKKLDSQTQGLSVKIGHAFATGDALKDWSWRNVAKECAPTAKLTLEAEACVAADDAKMSLQDMLDAPESNRTPECIGKDFGDAKAQDNLENRKLIALTQVEHDDQVRLPPLEDQSLTRLFGQLLRQKADENIHHLHDHRSDGTDSDMVSEHLDSGKNDGKHSDSAASTLSHQLSDDESPSLSTDEQRTLARAPASIDLQLDGYLDASKPECQIMKTSEEADRARIAKQTLEVFAAQAAQMHVAQWQMAQWQMEYSAQMAYWQHASHALYACQADQFHTDWTEDQFW